METAHQISGKARTLFRVLAYGSIALIAAIMAYAAYSLATQGIGVVGSSLVEVEFPPPSLSPIYAKPITLLYISTLVLLYTGLELSRERIQKLSPGTIHVLKLVAFGIGSIAFFELAYNLIFWSGELAAQAVLGHLNPDNIANPFPDLTHPINVVFASKVAACAFIGGVYSFYFLSGVRTSSSPAT